MSMNRRQFLKVSAAASGGLLIGFHLGGCEKSAKSLPAANDGRASLNAWLRIGSDDKIVIRVASSEMGQGVSTSLPMLIAEELEADWKQIDVEFAPVDRVYANPAMGAQATGGSRSVAGYFTPLREAGAAAREILIAAAAKQWKVNVSECHALNGEVIHKSSGKRLRFGSVAQEAAKLSPPEAVILKEPDEFRIIGKSHKRLDALAKINGSARYGQDVQLPGMRVAVIARCPVFGGKAGKVDDSKARAVKGVRDVVRIGGSVAVVADSFWAAKKGRDGLLVEWKDGELAALDDASIENQFKSAISAGSIAAQLGDAGSLLKSAGKKLSAVYSVPYLAHACMEPMNCTAHVQADGCDVWVGTQGQTSAQETAMELTGLSADKVRIHTQYLGGGFGRRGEQDFVAEAVQLSKAVGAPVKVMWTREDDMQHDFYRPATYNELEAAIDDKGGLLAWRHRIAGPSILDRRWPNPDRAIDRTSTEGAATIPYAIPNMEVSYAMMKGGVPVGFWRSVGSSQNAFITECFLDEMATLAGKDPYDFRHAMLADKPRHKRVLELAAEKAGWGNPVSKGRARGIALAESFGSIVAQVAEVSIEDKQPVVHRVTCAIDCGIVVNPDTVVAQMESGIVYGLTAALYGEINIKAGRVVQSNFHDYPMLRMSAMPQVDVHIVAATESPGGVGEPGTPPIAPAVANAVFALTGNPVRKLPIRL